MGMNLLDLLLWIAIFLGVGLATILNYYLNWAPGSEPDDFNVGPPEMQLSCDCYLNTLIIGGIVAIALAVNSSLFASRIELYITAITAFFVVSAAGIVGRKRRYNEWKEIQQVIARAIPESGYERASSFSIDIEFTEDEEDID